MLNFIRLSSSVVECLNSLFTKENLLVGFYYMYLEYITIASIL